MLHVDVFFQFGAICAQLDHQQKFVQSMLVRKLCYKALEMYAPHSAVSCDSLQKNNNNKTIIIIINILLNNLYKMKGDTMRKQQFYVN